MLIRWVVPVAAVLASRCSGGGTPTSDHPHGCATPAEGPARRVVLSATQPPTVTFLLRTSFAVRAPKFSSAITLDPPGQLVLVREDHGEDPAVAVFETDRLGAVRIEASGARATVEVVCHSPSPEASPATSR